MTASIHPKFGYELTDKDKFRYFSKIFALYQFKIKKYWEATQSEDWDAVEVLPESFRLDYLDNQYSQDYEDRHGDDEDDEDVPFEVELSGETDSVNGNSRETTPYPEAQFKDENIFYRGLPAQWDDDHRFTYFVPSEIAKSKYKHLVEKGVLTEWDEEEYMDDIEEYQDDREEYQLCLSQIPWREKHHKFSFQWGWCLDKEKGAYCIPIDSDAIIEWAGLDEKDLICEVPIEF